MLISSAVLSLYAVFCVDADESIEAVCSSASPVCVAGLLKTYLIELPDTVIPEQHYNIFIDSASKIVCFYFLQRKIIICIGLFSSTVSVLC